MEEEKIETLTRLLQNLLGEMVYITHSHSPGGELIGEYVVIGKITEPGRYNYYVARNGSLSIDNNYIGNIVSIAKSHLDDYRKDDLSQIYYKDESMSSKKI
jgi:hypothetical protein